MSGGSAIPSLWKYHPSLLTRAHMSMDLILTYTDILWLWNILGTNHALFLYSGVYTPKSSLGGQIVVLSPSDAFWLWPTAPLAPLARGLVPLAPFPGSAHCRAGACSVAAAQQGAPRCHGATGQRGNRATAATFQRKQRLKWESGSFFSYFLLYSKLRYTLRCAFVGDWPYRSSGIEPQLAACFVCWFSFGKTHY